MLTQLKCLNKIMLRQAMGSTACNELAGVAGAASGCTAGLVTGIVAFGCLQMLLSQLRDFHSLW